MQVSSLLSRKEIREHHHDHDDDCGHDHEHTQFRLTTMIAGVVFIANSFFMEWFGGTDDRVAGVSAFIGAIILGFPILKLAVKSILRGMLTINELVAIAFLAAIASGESQLGGYQTAGIVAFFMLLGELIETRTAAGARASIASLVKMTPTKARRIVGDGEEEVTASDLKVGDVIRIRPGDNVAADGKILKGQGSINQANITGESLPVDKATGEEVFAGTTNLTGVLEVEVTRAGEDTTFGRVRDLILAAEQTKLPIMRIIDQYMGYYTPLVLVIAGIVWFFTQDIERVFLGAGDLLPVRIHPRLAHGDGGRAGLGRPAGDSHQERRRHRDRGAHQRLCVRQNRHADHRRTRGQPPGSAGRCEAG